MNDSQRHFMDLCPIPAKPAAPARRPRRTVVAEPPRYSGPGRERVLSYIQDCGTFGATDEEMQVQIPLPPNTQRPRRVELLRARLIKDSGKTRRTVSGIPAVVWVDASVEVKHQ